MRIQVAVVAIALSSLMPNLARAQFQRDPAVIQAYEEGVALLQAEEWESAIAKFDTAIALDDGTFPQLYFGKAEALRELEDYQNAIKTYQLALQADDTFAQAYNGRGICHRESGNLQLALNDFQNAADLDRRDPSIAANLGDILVNNVGNFPQAMIYLDRAIELDPEDPETYRNRGWAHTQLREFEEAIADFQQSIELDPKKYETHQGLANVYFLDDDIAAGIESLSQAIELYEPEDNSEPNIYIGGYLQRCDARIKLAKEKDQTLEQRTQLYQGVVADADTILAEFDDRPRESGTAFYLRGLALRMQGLYAEAITSLTDAIQLIPPGGSMSFAGNAYLTRGICWFYQEQNKLARGDFREAASLSLEDPLPHLWMGYTHAQEGDYRKAINYYGEASAKSPGFPLAHANKGLAYMQLEDYEKAVDNFNNAIRSEPTEPAHFYKRGVAHENLGEWQKALDSYNLALLRDKEYDDARRGAARALRQLGRPGLGTQYENKVNSAR